MSTVTQRYIHTAPVTLHVQQYRYVDTVCGLLPCRSQTVIPAVLVAGAAIREIALYPAGTIGGARTSDATGRRWKCGASVVRNQDCARSRQEPVAEHVYGPFLLVRGDHYATSGDVLTPLLPASVLWGMGSRHLVLSAILPVAAVAAPVQPKGFGDGGPGGEGVYLGPVDRRQHAGDPGGGVVGAGVQSQGDVSGGR